MATRCLENSKLHFLECILPLLCAEQSMNLVNFSVLISSLEQWLKTRIQHVTKDQLAPTPIIENIGPLTN